MLVRGKKVTDRRIQKTQNLLRGALTSLIGEKPYDSIVVKEILDRANVGRSTFYTHFRDKDDLLVSGIHDMFRPVQSPARPSSGERYDRILWFSFQFSNITISIGTREGTESEPEEEPSCMNTCAGCSPRSLQML